MTIQTILDITGATLLTPNADLARQVKCGYCCDLLSWVMSHGKPDMALITVQTHMNVIAIATLLDMACVIIPEGISVPEDVLAKAEEEDVAVLSCPKGYTGYEIGGKLYQAGLPSAGLL